MASSLPVVSTAVGDVPLMVAEENAPFITALDDAALAAALAAMALDRNRRHQVGLANLAKAQRDFDQAAMFVAHGALWRG
jgi:glycosyltransferase involved in cell wall biosynthesis